MTDPGTWQAVVPVPPDTPPPVLPEGFTGVPYTVAGSLHGYVTRNAAGKVYPLAWCQNGSPDAREWRWAAIPGLDDPASVLAPAAAPAQPQAAPRKRARKAPDPEPPPAVEGDPGAGPDAVQHAEPADGPVWPFTMLGHDRGTYFYLPHAGKQLTALTAGQHNAANFARLAPESFWSRRWEHKKGFDAQQAAFDLMTAQHDIGIYSPDRIRGRGSWWDREAGHAVTHLGDRLIINGAIRELHDHGTRYIYEAGNQLPLAPGLGAAAASKLEDICKEISWESPMSARLLAGWIVCALVCGALRWKPNIWLLGPVQSGKSTVIEKIAHLALGTNAIYALGSTTAASLRALLRADALPVIIDDMDSATARGRENNQAIFELMRIFSGEGSGAVHKASQTGGAPISYKIHSCYIYSSIRMEAEAGADLSRIAVLKLKPRSFSRGQYEELLALIHSTLTPEFSEGLFGRCVRLIPTIRKNAETFAQSFAGKTESRRSGDVFGHLLAGAYALKSDKVITPEAADDYVGTRDEVRALVYEEKIAATENNDGDKCLAHLLEQVLTDTYDGHMMRASVYELLQRVRLGDMQGDHADKLLRRNGIICKEGFFYVANNHSAVRDLMTKSAWPTGWGDILKTVKNAEATTPRHFGSRDSRTTKIPLSNLVAPDTLEPTPPPEDEPGLL